MSAADPVARRLIVSGRVQGVFFRDWTVATARAAGVAGWVRNRADGTVEVHAEGDPAAVASLVGACHAGPPSARVERVDVSDVPAEGATRFERRRSA